MSKSKEKTVPILTIQELKEIIKACRIGFLKDRFTEMAELYLKNEKIKALIHSDTPDRKERLSELLIGWPHFNVGNVVYDLTFTPMFHELKPPTKIAADIEAAALNGTDGNTVIDFNRMEQILDGKSYVFDKTMIKVSSSEIPTRYIGSDEKDNCPYIAYIGGDDENKRMHLASMTTKEGFIVADNVDEFSVLSAIRYITSDGKDNVTFIFTCFGILHTEVLPSLEGVELSLESIEEMDIKEPQSDILDGCYCYLKNMNSIPTTPQRHFFINYYPIKTVKTYTDEEIANLITLAERVDNP